MALDQLQDRHFVFHRHARLVRLKRLDGAIDHCRPLFVFWHANHNRDDRAFMMFNLIFNAVQAALQSPMWLCAEAWPAPWGQLSSQISVAVNQ